MKNLQSKRNVNLKVIPQKRKLVLEQQKNIVHLQHQKNILLHLVQDHQQYKYPQQ